MRVGPVDGEFFVRILNAVETLPRRFLGLEYERYLEWPAVTEMLQLGDGLHVLDVGSGGRSLLPLAEAWFHRCDVLATDLSDPLAWLRQARERVESKFGLAGRLEFRSAVDARDMPLESESFDRISSCSVVEHIPDEGDSAAMREIGRILRKGGRAVISVPFAAKSVDEYMSRDVYERRRAPREEVVFFQRRYSFEDIEKRLVGPSDLVVADEIYLAEPSRPFMFEMTPRAPHDGGLLLVGGGMARLKRLIGSSRYPRQYLRRWKRGEAVAAPDKVRVAIFCLAHS